ncbi:hypothetical protein NC651_008091 [Populus alba x Populus x berolinensis]|nr:hypothetical protein NC651_008091 [Populus alba x Populus x berolinensis]
MATHESYKLSPLVENRVWGGPVRWLLMGHWFTARDRGEVVGDGIHNDDAARAGVIEFVTRGGCYDVEELVPAVGGMWSVIMVGRFVVTLDG